MADPRNARSSPCPADARIPAAATTRRIDVRDLLGGAAEAVIVHAGREYRLRVTSNGKLILTA